MENLSKKAIELLALCDGLVEGCKGCGGSTLDRGTICTVHNPCTRKCAGCPTIQNIIPCSTCQPWRELRKELCWHEIVRLRKRVEGVGGYINNAVCRCGYGERDVESLKSQTEIQAHLNKNPNLTTAQHGDIPLIVYWMQVLGIWDEFLDWQVSRLNAGNMTIYEKDFADILITGTLRLEAVVSFLEGREG